MFIRIFYKRPRARQIKFQQLFDEYELYFKDRKLKQIKFNQNEDEDDNEDTKQKRQKDKKRRPGLTECITVAATLDCEPNED